MPFFRSILIASFAVINLAMMGCLPSTDQANTVNTNTANQQANIVTNANSNTNAEAAKELANVPLTMPMLDALLLDDEFVSEARMAVQLSDEELDKLKTRSRDAVLNLSADPSEDLSRSTREATEAAKKEVREVLGERRGNEFIAVAQRRWKGGDAELAGRPGLIPTDDRVVVNIPAYRMDIFDDGKLVKSYKVGIGYPEFPLPTGLRKADQIIFNPTWTPPDEPWVKGKVSPGKTVKAGDKLNPLGPIKIPIGLPSLIHGGKAPSRLGTFASHGCVGLTNPQIQDFAAEISKISDQPITLEDIKGYEKKKTDTQEVKLGKDIPVELRYETIVVEDGILKIYRDVYERGTNTEENLRRVLSEVGISFDSLDQALRKKVLDGLEDMAVDAVGNPVDDSGNSNTNSANRDTNSADSKNANSSGRVTRNIKGKKELSFVIPGLAGKGYPAPVGMK